MPKKSYAAKVKATAADDASLGEGQFTALASVFHNVDEVGDVVMPGAFADTLKAWEESNQPIPVYWAHRMDDPSMNVGSVLEAAETDTGLQVKAQLDLENPTAVQVYRLLKGGRVSRMSFSYDVQDAAPAERDGKSVYELRKLKLHEVSVVQVPANPEATVQEVKAADPAGKAGRVLSAKNEATLKGALAKFSAGLADVKSVLAALEPSDDGKAKQAQPPAADEPDEATVAGVRSSPASVRLRVDLDDCLAEIPLND